MRENDNEWDPERTSIVVKILLDHLKMNDLIFPYLATKMEEGGKPSTVNDFISKLMRNCKTVAHSLRVIELCGFKAVPRYQTEKRREESQTQNSTVLSDNAMRKRITTKLTYK